MTGWLKAQMEGSLGLFVYDSRANYLFPGSGASQGGRRNPQPHDACLKNGVLIRSCASYRGLDGRFYRICVRTGLIMRFIRVL